MARHFLNLKGAQTVATGAFKLTRRAIADVYQAAAMGVIHGEAGLGKTFAVEQALGGWPDIESCWAAFPSQPTMRQVTTTLLELITRVPSAERNRFYATALLIDELARRPRVVVIDEAQRLNRECIECLRHLHDHPATTFALLLVGGDGCWEVLSREPMLRSRIYRRVTFRPLESREVLDVLPRYHRLYQHVDGELLLFIDDNFAHGNFRNWASFTGWNSYTLRPSLNALSDTLRRELHRAHSGRASLNPKVAFILLGVINAGGRESWLHRLPAADRNGVELLMRQGLIERTGREHLAPTADVVYSLHLEPLVRADDEERED